MLMLSSGFLSTWSAGNSTALGFLPRVPSAAMEDFLVVANAEYPQYGDYYVKQFASEGGFEPRDATAEDIWPVLYLDPVSNPEVSWIGRDEFTRRPYACQSVRFRWPLTCRVVTIITSIAPRDKCVHTKRVRSGVRRAYHRTCGTEICMRSAEDDGDCGVSRSRRMKSLCKDAGYSTHGVRKFT